MDCNGAIRAAQFFLIFRLCTKSSKKPKLLLQISSIFQCNGPVTNKTDYSGHGANVLIDTA